MVQCSRCGFLAVRDGVSQDAREAIREVRSTGVHQNAANKSENARFFCFANSQAFPTIPPQPSLSMHSPQGNVNPAVAAIGGDVACGNFFPWQPGQSPKEHWDLWNAAIEQQQEATRNEESRKEEWAWRREVEGAIERRHQETQVETRNAAKTAAELADRHFKEAERLATKRFWIGWILSTVIAVAAALSPDFYKWYSSAKATMKNPESVAPPKIDKNTAANTLKPMLKPTAE